MMGLDAESEPHKWDAAVGKRLAYLDTYQAMDPNQFKHVWLV